MSTKYIKYYVILGCALTIALVAVFMLMMPDRCSLPAVLTPILFSALSIVSIKIMERPSVTTFIKFSNAFMLTNAIKLFADLIFLLVSYLNIDHQKRFTFVVVVLVMYVIYATVDTVLLLRMFKNKDSQSK